jgi:hypothetical protein
MEKLVGSQFYGWSRGVGAAVATFLGMYAALKDRKVMGLTPVGWFVLALISAEGVILHMQAKILAAVERLERS